MRILIFHGYLLSGTGSNVYTARLAATLVRLGHEVHLLAQERHPREHRFIDAAGDWDSGSLRVTRVRSSSSAADPPVEPGGSSMTRPRRAASSASAADRAAESHDRSGESGDDLPVAQATCTLYRPPIGSLLPVYVEDRYQGFEAKAFARCSDAELACYLDANVRAAREVQRRSQAEVALANHVLMGPVILARALSDSGCRYAVKAHGSALEYTLKPGLDRFLPYAREGLVGAEGVLAGSRHTGESLLAALGEQWCARHRIPARLRVCPPGVDVEAFGPAAREQAVQGLGKLAAQLSGSRLRGARAGRAGSVQRTGRSDSFARDDALAARALERLASTNAPTVVYVGKLIVAKGVDLLLAAWPIVLQAVPAARLAIVGFGPLRVPLMSVVAALQAGDLAAVRSFAQEARSLERRGDRSDTGTLDTTVELDVGSFDLARDHPLRFLLSFLDSLDCEQRGAYLRAAKRMSESVLFTGRLEHDALAQLLPACEAIVVPSTFPEAFGMVAVEGAACGALPVSAAHSGLAEVSDAFARGLQVHTGGGTPEHVGSGLHGHIGALLSFPLDDDAVRAIADRLKAWLALPQEQRDQARRAIAAVARSRWSWEAVAQGVLRAAEGDLRGLPAVREPQLHGERPTTPSSE